MDNKNQHKLNFNRLALVNLFEGLKRIGVFSQFANFDDWRMNRDKTIEKVKDQSLAILEAMEKARIRGV
jgi:hypothetical protein